MTEHEHDHYHHIGDVDGDVDVSERVHPRHGAHHHRTRKCERQALKRLGGPVQVANIESRVESAYAVSACSYNMMSRFQTLVSISTCAATAGDQPDDDAKVPGCAAAPAALGAVFQSFSRAAASVSGGLVACRAPDAGR
jgi:hypothetical protein